MQMGFWYLLKNIFYKEARAVETDAYTVRTIIKMYWNLQEANYYL